MLDWKTKLAQFIEERQGDTFIWGKSDCCLFAADAWIVICGTDIAHWFRDRYTTKIGAYRLLNQHSHGGVSKTLTKLAREFKMEKIKKSFIQNGDMCLVKTDLGDAMGIAWNGKVVTQGPKNLVMLPKNLVLRAWRLKKIGE
jgi:CTP:molybdopterin cytidylyltransferase MocA